jgi:hypothetical protein
MGMFSRPPFHWSTGDVRWTTLPLASGAILGETFV